MVSLKHKFQTLKADGIDTTLVKPSNWNAEHDLTQGTKAVLGAMAAGNTTELPLVSSTGADDGTIWTKQAIMDAIAAVVAGIVPGAETGDIIASVNSTKLGWLQLIGQTIGNVGSSAQFANASAHDLFVLFWGNIFDVAWPINGGRGASAEADWTALKTITLPNAHGRVLGMVDALNGVNTLLQKIGDIAGEQNHFLGINEIPKHTHTYASVLKAGSSLQGGGGAYMDINLDQAGTKSDTGPAGGNIGGDTGGHNNVQPTLAIIYHIKL